MMDRGFKAFNLTCRVETSIPQEPVFVNWFKENIPVSSNRILKDRYQELTIENDFVLKTMLVYEDDYGNYTCKLQDPADMSASFKVYGKPYARLLSSQSVVEGQKIKIICKVLGKPYPTVSWMYNNDTVGAANETIVASERFKFETNNQGVENAVLVLTDAVLSDCGKYYCQATSIVGNFVHVAATTLYVNEAEQTDQYISVTSIVCTAVGAIVCLVLIAAVIFCCRRREERARRAIETTQYSVMYANLDHPG